MVVGNAQSKSALRQQNRTLIKQHPEWFPGPLKASNHRWQELAENDHFLSSDHLHNMTEVAIHRLEQQLGKPYLWGGTRPDQGFDCSGLIFMPTTKFWRQNCRVRRMKCITTGGRRLSPIVTFVVVIYCSFIFIAGILPIIWASTRQGQFIESPRTGETIRVSNLSDDFWQDHYLGARRILTENTIL